MEKKKPIRWIDKVINVREVKPEPPLNKEGFWKKLETEEPKVHD